MELVKCMLKPSNSQKQQQGEHQIEKAEAATTSTSRRSRWKGLGLSEVRVQRSGHGDMTQTSEDCMLITWCRDLRNSEESMSFALVY